MSERMLIPLIHELAPLLIVGDIARSVEFYVGKLGFQVTMNWEPDGQLQWCRLERDSSALMLQQACEEDGSSVGRGRGVLFYFNSQDANAEHARLVAAGLSVQPPKVAFYGMNQLYLTDPDGYELCFQNIAGEESDV